MKVRPLHDRVLIERIEAESKTAGGIIIPDTAKEKPSEGKVVAVGEGLRDDHGKRIALDVKKKLKLIEFWNKFSSFAFFSKNGELMKLRLMAKN